LKTPYRKRIPIVLSKSVYLRRSNQPRAARDGEKIDNIDQAHARAVANGVENLVIQPTHLMHGAE
jgi:hypothetical protein